MLAGQEEATSSTNKFRLKVLITGSKGFIGSVILKHLSQNLDVQKLNYVRGSASLYPQLNESRGKDTCIIHSGASSKRDKIGKEIYKDNWTAIVKLVNHVSAYDTRKLVFFSANSINDSNNRSEGQKDLYSHLKLQAEKLIQEKLKPWQYTIIRLPGVYHQQKCGEGFLDRLCSPQVNNKKMTIRTQALFNSIIDIDDLGLFLLNRLEQRKFDGYVGSLGSVNPIKLGLVIDLLMKMNKLKADIVIDNREYESQVIDPTNAIRLGYPQRSTLELIEKLFSRK